MLRPLVETSVQRYAGGRSNKRVCKSQQKHDRDDDYYDCCHGDDDMMVVISNPQESTSLYRLYSYWALGIARFL